MHRFIGQRTGARDDADLALLVNDAGHNADLAFARGDDAGAVGADQLCSVGTQRSFHIERSFNVKHIQYRNAFCNTDNDFNAGIRSFQDRIGCERCRHINHRGLRTGLPNCVTHGVEYRQTQVRLPALSRRHAADHAGAIGNRLFGMKRALFAGEALANNLSVLVNEDAHCAFSTASLAA